MATITRSVCPRSNGKSDVRNGPQGQLAQTPSVRISVSETRGRGNGRAHRLDGNSAVRTRDYVDHRGLR